METRNPGPVVLGAVLVVALVAADAVPALRGAPLLFCLLAAALQIDRELAAALTPKWGDLAAPVMNLVTALVVLHLAYFRSPTGSTLLELVNTVLLAFFVLVIVSAIGAELKQSGLIRCVGHTLAMLLLPLLTGGGLGFCLLLQTRYGAQVTREGTWLVAGLLAASWLGLGVGRTVEGRPVGYGGVTPAGHLARFGVGAAVALVVGFSGLGGHLPPGAVVALAAAIGLGLVLGFELVRGVAALAEIDSFRYRLPHQIEAAQPVYDRLFVGGLVDYAGPLIPVWPLAWLALRVMHG